MKAIKHNTNSIQGESINGNSYADLRSVFALCKEPAAAINNQAWQSNLYCQKQYSIT